MHDYVGPPLDRQRLASVLTANGVSERAYHLYGAHQHDALVVDQRPQGWIIFYSERGGEDILATHASEDEACLDLLNRLLDDQWNRFELVAGPALPAEADAEFVAWLHAHGLTQEDLGDEDLKVQDSPWKAGEPDYRRYFIHSRRIREAGR
jgi:hypothetical protein